ncbi:MAG: hypothetical protein HY801_02370 [Candidatus Lindowbacteria bacterium]|nr:hypothetical protein [Candidatus Lindowbacteria bacterium]
MSSASIAFLWHMHQPFYLDRMTGEVSMPWVRLHACKGYYDMISLLEDFPQIRATFNIVPSLVTQLSAYCEGTAKDKFLEFSLIPAKELTPAHKKFILRDFFQANWDNMIRPYKRYWEIMTERGLHLEAETINQRTGLPRHPGVVQPVVVRIPRAQALPRTQRTHQEGAFLYRG